MGRGYTNIKKGRVSLSPVSPTENQGAFLDKFYKKNGMANSSLPQGKYKTKFFVSPYHPKSFLITYDLQYYVK